MIVQLLVSGIAVGIVYGLIAMGMVLIFRAVGIMNFAQGDFLMFGGYFAYTFNQMLGLNIVLSLILASLCMGVIGVIFMRTSYWALRGAQAKAIIVSAMGASIVLKEGARLIWGSIPVISTIEKRPRKWLFQAIFSAFYFAFSIGNNPHFNPLSGAGKNLFEDSTQILCSFFGFTGKKVAVCAEGVHAF